MQTNRKIDKLVIHCTATHPYQDFDIEDVTRWHTAPKPNGRGWSRPGYHYLIKLSGEVQIGCDINRAGIHARGHNRNSIALALVGGLDRNGRPSPDFFRKEQWASLSKLVQQFKSLYPDAEIVGHNQLGPKACPSFRVDDWLKFGSVVPVS